MKERVILIWRDGGNFCLTRSDWGHDSSRSFAFGTFDEARRAAEIVGELSGIEVEVAQDVSGYAKAHRRADLSLADAFGGCPECNGCDGLRNAGKGHWAFCDNHRTMWFIGVNLFADAKVETEAEQIAAWHLDSYHEVEPAPAPRRAAA